MTKKDGQEEITDDMLPYAHWLYNIAGVGSKTIKMLLSYIKTPKEIYSLSAEEITERIPMYTKRRELAKRIADDRKSQNIWDAYETLGKRQIHFTCLGHLDYPSRLVNISDAPYGLYFRGRLPDKVKPCMAIIGARNCSEYGRQMACLFGAQLAAKGVQIISGMARGIDGIGQYAALEAGGYSLGVLGCGVDICYPKENQKLYDMLCENGGVCSEYPPQTPPKSSLFPPRNRIISALSDTILVVEAKNKSGTLITVDMALEQGKDVYAIPGRITEALSEGCNRLLQQGAQVALSPGQMLKDMAGKEILLSDLQRDILQSMDDVALPLEKIKERVMLSSGRDIPLTEVMNQLIKLSLSGWVRQIGNSHFFKT